MSKVYNGVHDWLIESISSSEGFLHLGALSSHGPGGSVLFIVEGLFGSGWLGLDSGAQKVKVVSFVL